MLREHRHRRILSILAAEGAASLAELHALMPESSRVTLRRDLADLAEAGALRRTHGGATLPDAEVLRPPPALARPRLVPAEPDLDTSRLDAVILPPVGGPGSEALRRRLARGRMPFLAESAPQAGGVYLGPDNRGAGEELGELAGRELAAGPVALLVVGQPDQANTRDRAEGFEAGLRRAHGGPVRVVRVNGQATYRTSFRVALDALRANEEISLAFAVNDHGATAILEAAGRVGRRLRVYATGGEAPDFVAGLLEDRGLAAVAAFFPEVVGARGIDLVADALLGRPLPAAAATPHAILTRANLGEIYERGAAGWQLIPAVRAALIGRAPPERPRWGRPPRPAVGFLPHYPAHDWYRVMIQAMEARARDWGLSLVVAPPHRGIAAELARLRKGLAALAADRIEAGQTLILGQGKATRLLAEEIRRRTTGPAPRLAGLTVVTNALDVLERLDGVAALKVILTSGEYQRADRCLVGPSLGALFERVRADQAFLSVDGLTPEFGVSMNDERLALAGSRLLRAARRGVVLADHTAIGADATHRVARADEIHEVITDDGALPADRQRLRGAGLEVLVAGDGPDDRGEDGRTQSG
jgi:DeoR/GlpR family transcriptional regulator of sugar metabolism/ABC-type sugar transport system substrate-binding protein